MASFLINLLHNNIIIINNNNNSIRNIDLCGVYHNGRVRRPRDWSGEKSPVDSIQKEGRSGTDPVKLKTQMERNRTPQVCETVWQPVTGCVWDLVCWGLPRGAGRWARQGTVRGTDPRAKPLGCENFCFQVFYFIKKS